MTTLRDGIVVAAVVVWLLWIIREGYLRRGD